MAGPEARRYRAFISYSHRDRKAGDRLFAYLDGYRPPKPLVGRQTSFGPVPAKLYPIFRDREELTASPALAGRLADALAASDHLVVICSPHAAASPWVNEEIRMFRQLGRGSRIAAAIVDGEPAQAFPPALTEGGAGPPLATDLRAEADGWTDGPLKLVAAILGLGFGELKDREAARARTRARVRTLLVSGIAGLALLAVVGAVLWSWTARDSEKLLAEAVRRTATDLGGAVRFADRIGMSRDLIEQTLYTTEQGLESVYGIAIGSPWLPWRKRAALQPLQAGRAELLMVYADHYGVIGKSDRQLDAAQRALALLAEVARSDLANVARQRQLAMAHDLLGYILASRWDTTGALASFRSALAIRQELARSEPDDPRLQRDLSMSESRIGDILRRQGRIADALDAYRSALSGAQRLAALSPGSAELQRDVLVGQHKLGDLLLKRNDLEAAETAYRSALSLAEQLAAADAMNLPAQRDLSISHDKVGDVLYRRDRFGPALASYQASLAIAERLAAADPKDVSLQRDMALSLDNIGDACARLDRPAEAEDSFRRALAIREARAAADPDNALAQRDLSVSRIRIGKLQAAQGRWDQAIAEYRSALAIRQRLALIDPASMQSQRDLSYAHAHIGRALRGAGQPDRAIAEYRAALAIAERLAESDPPNPDGWDEVFAYRRILGELRKDAAKSEDARAE